MATTISETLADDIISKSALEAFGQFLTNLNFVSTSFSDDVVNRGNSVTVPLWNNITATDGTGSEDDYENDGGSIGSVQVNIDKRSKATVGLSDLSMMNSSIKSLESFGGKLGEAVGVKVLTELMKLITKTNFPTTITPEAGCSLPDLIIDARMAMKANNVPGQNRHLFPSDAAYKDLLKATGIQVASALVYGDDTVIKDGSIPRFLGFNVHECSIMPTSTSAPNGFVIHPNALALATRPIVSQSKESYLTYRIIVDKTTGITMSLRKHYSTKKAKMFYTVETQYGISKAIPEACILLPSIPAVTQG